MKGESRLVARGFQETSSNRFTYTMQKMKFSIKNLFNKCDQIRRKLRI